MDPYNPALPGSTQSVTNQPASGGNEATAMGNLTAGVQQPADSPLVFPKPIDQARLNGYSYFDKLYFGNHYEAFSMRAQQTFTDQYSRLRYITGNFAGLMSRIMADMLFGERVTIDFETLANQDFCDALMEDNTFISQCYESALANSRRGDSVFKLRIGQRNLSDPDSPTTVIIEETPPTIYYPVLDTKNARYVPSQDVLAWQFTQDGKTYLHKETHTPGYITHEIFSYDPRQNKIISTMNPTDFGFPEFEETLVNRSLVFHVPNVRDGSGFFGTSDYFDLTPLFFALNNRLTKIDNVLDSHSDPILAVPPGVIDEQGNFRKEALHLFEVDSENPGFNKPEYIIWNANLDAAFKQVDNLINLMLMFSEISPGSVGWEQVGAAARIESGRALKLKLLRTIAKRNRKKVYYDQVIKDLLETAQDLAIAHNISIDGKSISKSERPTIDWGEGIMQDITDAVANEVSRVDAGLSSRADSIARLDGISPDEAATKVEEIDKENTSDLPFVVDGAPFAPIGTGKTVPPGSQPMNPLYNKPKPNQPNAGGTSVDIPPSGFKTT